jgi:DNA-binding GntR family transcriptional regulator
MAVVYNPFLRALVFFSEWYATIPDGGIMGSERQADEERSSAFTDLLAGSAKETVYSALRKSIINLNLLPGTAISEKEISLRFKVSRTPVREAFIHLSRDGLVRVIPQRETRVSLIGLGRVRQEFFLRESLENSVLEPFLEKAGAESFAEMEYFLALQRKAFDTSAYAKFVDYDDSFHRVLFEAAGQALSWQVLSRLCGHYHRVRLLSIWLAGIGEEILGQHEGILAAAREKDPRGLRDLLRVHLHGLEAEEQLMQEKFPGYFTRDNGESGFDLDFGGLSPLTMGAPGV